MELVFGHSSYSGLSSCMQGGPFSVSPNLMLSNTCLAFQTRPAMAKFGRHLPNLGQVRRDVGPHRLILFEIGQHLTNSGQPRPTVCRLRPESRLLGQLPGSCSAIVGQPWGSSGSLAVTFWDV